MGTRITRKQLESVADTLTDVMRRSAVITERERVVVYGDISGWRFDVTGATIADGTGHRTGVAGLRGYCAPARDAYDSASAVIGALHAARMAQQER